MTERLNLTFDRDDFERWLVEQYMRSEDPWFWTGSRGKPEHVDVCSHGLTDDQLHVTVEVRYS